MHLPELEILIRLVVAAVLGSLVGIERERLLWSAGLRTHMVVCVGSCLFMIVSAYGFAGIESAVNVNLDPSRVAAQVVSGIGFLGAGAILARGEVVRGLTTAASIWTVAAIGLAVGGGLYFAAGACTAIILLILAGIKPIEEAYRARNQSLEISIEAERGALTPEKFRQSLKLDESRIKRFLVKARKGRKIDDITVLITRVVARDASSYITRIGKLQGVREVRRK